MSLCTSASIERLDTVFFQPKKKLQILSYECNNHNMVWNFLRYMISWGVPREGRDR